MSMGQSADGVQPLSASVVAVFDQSADYSGGVVPEARQKEERPYLLEFVARALVRRVVDAIHRLARIVAQVVEFAGAAAQLEGALGISGAHRAQLERILDPRVLRDAVGVLARAQRVRDALERVDDGARKIVRRVRLEARAREATRPSYAVLKLKI
jgi:hypothetical protein